MSNFQLNEEELTIEADAKEIHVKNYLEGAHLDRRTMRTQLTLR